MKFPTSPLLLGLALSSSTLAYPAPPSARSPNPENSPLLGGDDAYEERSFNINERAPSRLSKTWKRQAADNTGGGSGEDGNSTVNAQGLASTVGGLTDAVGGITAGTPLGGIVNPLLGTVNGVIGGLLPEGDGSQGPVSSLLGGLGLGGLLDTVKGTVGGLPLAGPLLGGVLNNLDTIPGGAAGAADTAAGTAGSVPGQGLSIIANLGGGKFLTSAGTVLQLPQSILGAANGATQDPSSLPSSLFDAVGGASGNAFAALPGGAGDTASQVVSIPINTAQGVVRIPLSLLQGVLGTATGVAGGPAGTATGVAKGVTGLPGGILDTAASLPGPAGGAAGTAAGVPGTLINIGGQMVPLSDIIGLLQGVGSNAPFNPFDMVGIASMTGSGEDTGAVDSEADPGAGQNYADAYGMDGNETVSMSSMEPMASNSVSASAPASATMTPSSLYDNPYPSAQPSGTSSASDLVSSMIARKRATSPLDMAPAKPDPGMIQPPASAPIPPPSAPSAPTPPNAPFGAPVPVAKPATPTNAPVGPPDSVKGAQAPAAQSAGVSSSAAPASSMAPSAPAAPSAPKPSAPVAPPAALPVKAREEDVEDYGNGDSDDDYGSEDELWGDFENGN